MKIGVLGLGEIAQKAYLPTYISMQERASFYFATRNRAVQKELQEKYHLDSIKNNLQELIAEGVEACFIHTATASHYDLVKECLLHDLHVFVDKPLSENVQEVLELQELAKQHKKILMVGFNRRFAPMVDELRRLPEKRVIYLQKNAVNTAHPTTFQIYDVFLHLVDTAVYLLEEPILDFDSTIRESETGLERAFLRLETEQTSALVTMDLKSGANREVYQVTSPQGTYQLEGLTTLKKFDKFGTTMQQFDDWQITLEKRGFQQMVGKFLSAITSGETSHLRQENIALSHQLCAKMLKQHEEAIIK